MVGPGEVDDDLQPEVTEECSKYGEVVKCLVYEVSRDFFSAFYMLCLSNQIPSLPDYEAVRIFVEFSRVESAIKGMQSELCTQDTMLASKSVSKIIKLLSVLYASN